MRFDRFFVACSLAASAAVAPASAAAALLRVPTDHASIQAAIDAAPEGALIEVDAGVYGENIDFLGKSVFVEGAGPESVIQGDGTGSVVRFASGEGAGSVLAGFTIRGGFATLGGGILVQNSSPTILRNVIVENSASANGSGIYVGGAGAEPQIMNNLLMFNTGVNGGDPHTIQVVQSSPQIINNTIVRNDSNAILTTGGGAPIIRNNIFARNGSRSIEGGVKGRGICDFASGSLIQYNLFYRNVRSALLTAGTDFRTIRRAQRKLERESLVGNVDGAPRFTSGNLPADPEGVTVADFIPSEDPQRPSRALHAGDPDPTWNNVDGTRNTAGMTGGPYPLF